MTATQPNRTLTNNKLSHAASVALIATLLFSNFSYGQLDLGGMGKMTPHSLEQTWKLGGKIGLAASAYSFVSGPEDPNMKLIEAEFNEAKSMAKMLGVDLPDLPEFQNQKSTFAATVVHYMLKQLGDTTGRQLQKKHSNRHGLMFELAVKTYVLSITYHPQIDDRLTFAKMVADRSERVGFSEKIYQPLVEDLKNQKPYSDIKQQLFKFHQSVASNLKFQREIGLLTTARTPHKNYSMPKGFKLPEGFEVPGAMPSFMKSKQ